VKIFKEKGFVVERLGGTTTELPDVVAHKDVSELIIAIECKSSTGKYCNVPAKQIQRCIDECNKWGLYHSKMVLLAFKFGNKGTGPQRESRYFLKKWNMHMVPVDVICHYDGFCKSNGKDLWLEEFE